MDKEHRKIIVMLAGVFLIGCMVLVGLTYYKRKNPETIKISSAPISASNISVDQGCRIMICVEDSTELSLWAYNYVKKDQEKLRVEAHLMSDKELRHYADSVINKYLNHRK